MKKKYCIKTIPMEIFSMKKAYTLIEILIVLSLSVSIFSGATYTYKNISKLKDNLDLNFYSNYISTFINDCKRYCKDKDVGGVIQVSQNRDSLIFSTGLELVVNKLVFPKNIKIDEMITNREKIQINRRGFTSSACTIKLCNKYKIKMITIHVGTGYVDVKNEWKEKNNK